MDGDLTCPLFRKPSDLKANQNQWVVEKHDDGETKQVPIEDMGLLIMDDKQIAITRTLVGKLLQCNATLTTCDATPYPIGLLLDLDGHNLQSQAFQAQLETSGSLKKAIMTKDC